MPVCIVLSCAAAVLICAAVDLAAAAALLTDAALDATSPATLYPDRQALAPSRNVGFLVQCVERFPVVHFADQDTGFIYLRIADGIPTIVDGPRLRAALTDADTRAGIAAVAPDVAGQAGPTPAQPVRLHDVEGFANAHTLGRWGAVRA